MISTTFWRRLIRQANCHSRRVGSQRSRISLQCLGIERIEVRLLMTIQALTGVDPALYGDTASGASSLPSISSDGNIIAFQSMGNNLIPGVELPGEVYTYNRTTGLLTLVTETQIGGNAADQGGGTSTLVSSDGRYVVFTSRSKDLVSVAVGGDLNLD
ncbi:MAG: hypothetical protein JWN70_650 [Planctomycetaceae bacterium]|nr:hypothetical protein [Planctomycetaceae bacterium]